MNSNVIFNFGLLFDDSFSRSLVSASQLFSKHKVLEYSLGENSLPHVTILQFPAPLSEGENIWRKLSAPAMPNIEIHFHGLAFDRWRNWDGIWLRIKHCPKLREAQKQAAQILGNLEYVNSLGDAYEPHATLAAWPSENTLPSFPIPDAVLDRKAQTYYSLGISGPQFQYERCLFRQS